MRRGLKVIFSDIGFFCYKNLFLARLVFAIPAFFR